MPGQDTQRPESNALGSRRWRKAGDPMTGDDWASYDRIAPCYSQRLEQWRRGEIWPQVHHPR